MMSDNSRVISDDYSELEELYKAYNRQAFSLALKMLGDREAAEDLVQEAFVKVWQRSESYDPQRGRFATWLLTIVHNLCIDQLRKKRLKASSLDQDTLQDWLLYLPDNRTGPEEEAWIKQRREVIRRNLQNLSLEQRELIELAFFGGFSHSQIANKTGRSLGTVKYCIRQGLHKLNGCSELMQLTG